MVDAICRYHTYSFLCICMFFQYPLTRNCFKNNKMMKIMRIQVHVCMYIQPNAKSRLMGSSSPGNRKAHTHHAQIPKLLQVFLQIFFVPEHPFLRPPVVCTWGSIPPASKRHCNANKLALGSGNVQGWRTREWRPL
jgi:hypothetical protein